MKRYSKVTPISGIVLFFKGQMYVSQESQRRLKWWSVICTSLVIDAAPDWQLLSYIFDLKLTFAAEPRHKPTCAVKS